MKIKLRADQLMLVESVLQNIKEDNLVVSPSGSGKSYMLAYLEKLLTEQGYLVYVYAPTTIKQRALLKISIMTMTLLITS